MMKSVSLTFARFAVSAWVGGAVLFVVTGVREVVSTEVSSHLRDVLVGVRFPAYYCFGFTLIGTALACGLAARGHADVSGRSIALFAGLLAGALLLMIGDYVWIYTPLVEMVTPPGQAKPAEFRTYHEATKWINTAGILLCLGAAMVICRPQSGRDSRSTE